MITCPVCGRIARSRLRPPYADLSECACGLIVNELPVTESYSDAYFANDGALGHRDFDSEWANRYDRVRFTAELVRIERVVSGRRGLDVGAATGSFALLASERGWSVIGVEINDAARRIAARRGVESVEQTSDLPAGQTYDLITMHHVLEHLEQPILTLREFARLLKTGGRILIEVPNWRSFERRSMGIEWTDLRLDQHRWQFSPSSLIKLVTQAGLEIDSVYTLGEPLPNRNSLAHSTALGFLARAFKAHPCGLSNEVSQSHPTRSSCLRDAPPPAMGQVKAGSAVQRMVYKAGPVVDRALGVGKWGKRLVLVARQKQDA